jgi:hypothetical protein
MFEVEDISPPRRSLGVHELPPVRHSQRFCAGGAAAAAAAASAAKLRAHLLPARAWPPRWRPVFIIPCCPLPQNTHNGDFIELEAPGAEAAATYVVQSVVLQYKLVKGKYKQEHKRLEVNQTGRFLYNK